MEPHALEPVEVKIEGLEKYVTERREFQGIPGIEVTPGGRLWATWYSGGLGEGPDNYVVLVTSADQGETWTEPVAVVDPPGNVRAYDSAVWRDPLGRLWLFWSQCHSEKIGNIFDGRSGVWGSYAEDSEAERSAWSDPVRVANGVMMNKPMVLSNGEWAYPTAVWNDLGGKEVLPELRDERYSNITVSADQGRTYHRRGGADVPDRGFDEHHLVELNDGRIWCLVRTKNGIGQSFSEDGGKTWSPGEDSGLKGPGSRFFIRRLQSGKLLLVNHQVDPEKPNKRQKLTASLSDDDGRSWHGELMLDEREGVSYPDGVQDRDGAIWIIYDHSRYGEGDILFARFNEDDIEAGQLVSQNAALKCLINHSGGVRK